MKFFSKLSIVFAILFAFFSGAFCRPATETEPKVISKVMEVNDALPFLLNLFKSLNSQGAEIVSDISKAVK
jgi:hypothetical protein